MGYEVTVPLKIGTLEVEFDTTAELERKLRGLDVERIERAILRAVHGGDSRPKRGRKKSGKKARR